MKAIEPLESLNYRIHTICRTEILPVALQKDFVFLLTNPNHEGYHIMRSLHALRNAVISRRADVFVDMATYTLSTQLLQPIKPKSKLMDNSRTLAVSLLLVVVAFVAIFCMTWLRIERLEEKVNRMQQKIGYYEDTP